MDEVVDVLKKAILSTAAMRACVNAFVCVSSLAVFASAPVRDMFLCVCVCLLECLFVCLLLCMWAVSPRAFLIFHPLVFGGRRDLSVRAVGEGYR